MFSHKHPNLIVELERSPDRVPIYAKALETAITDLMDETFARADQRLMKSTTASRVSCGTHVPVRSRQAFF